MQAFTCLFQIGPSSIPISPMSWEGSYIKTNHWVGTVHDEKTPMLTHFRKLKKNNSGIQLNVVSVSIFAISKEFLWSWQSYSTC
jgi:hypothetical protein